MVMEGAMISSMKTAFEKNPLWLNVLFILVVFSMENVVEVEFVCPCNSKYNWIFATAHFVVPAFVVFLLMMNIQGYKIKRCRECIRAIISSSIPSFVWLILMFLDGNYFVCAFTYWPGRFVVLAKDAPQKWCEPTNKTTSQELMKKSQEWFSFSQGIAMLVMMALALPLVCTMCCKNKQKKEKSDKKDSDPQGKEGLEAFATTNV